MRRAVIAPGEGLGPGPYRLRAELREGVDRAKSRYRFDAEPGRARAPRNGLCAGRCACILRRSLRKLLRKVAGSAHNWAAPPKKGAARTGWAGGDSRRRGLARGLL
jgi:hypothetical protein